jgi:hypothetical protein
MSRTVPSAPGFQEVRSPLVTSRAARWLRVRLLLPSGDTILLNSPPRYTRSPASVMASTRWDLPVPAAAVPQVSIGLTE